MKPVNWAWIGLLCVAAAARAETVRIRNMTGDVRIRIVQDVRLQVVKTPAKRPVRPDDVTMRRIDNLIEIVCAPEDGESVELSVAIPSGLNFEVETRRGSIDITGMVSLVSLKTDSGNIRLVIPWRATRFHAEGDTAPKSFQAPQNLAGIKFISRISNKKTEIPWMVTDHFPQRHSIYGFVRLTAKNPGAIVLEDAPVPAESYIKLPWQAPEILERLLEPPSRAALRNAATPLAAESAAGAGAVFRSDVRVVALNVSVTDARGAPITGLRAGDFEILEEGEPQKVGTAGSEGVPFNLAILLDLSGSTMNDRGEMREATRRFIGIAKEEDKVAIYALARSNFSVISRLTKDRKALNAVTGLIPRLDGASPVYDSIVLAYAEELHQRPSERNALIVVTDGLDNQLDGDGMPSVSSFKKLVRAAQGMNALIYPIYLDPFDLVRPPQVRVRARKNMNDLAAASGGKLFRAKSAADLEPVYPQVAEELRSVYQVTYSPKNQDFHGQWRGVEVRVRRPGAVVRTRAGYIAQ